MHWGEKRRLCQRAGIGLLLVACVSSRGVKRDSLRVSDAWITTRAENEIEALLGKDADVKVRTKNGVVFLEGTVREVADAERVEAKVTQIRGVREIQNDLRVKP